MAAVVQIVAVVGRAMLSNPNHEDRFDRLAEQIRLSPVPTSELMSNVSANACTRLQILNKTGKADPVHQLIAAGAWNDAALALIELELPAWNLRRLVYEDGEWYCSLSQQAHLPLAFDDTVDATHEVLPLAIMAAFVEARRKTFAAPAARLRTTPGVQPKSGYVVCCDNFA
jgi:hypothetical protein